MQPIHRSPLAFFLVLGLSESMRPIAALAAEGPGSGVTDYFRLIWGLLVVLGIILVLYGFVKKRFSLLSAGTNQEIRIVEMKPLLGKKALCLINVRGQEHLLGISGDNITHLATLPPQPKSSFATAMQATGVTPQS